MTSWIRHPISGHMTTRDFSSSVWFPSNTMISALTKSGKRLWDASRFITSNECICWDIRDGWLTERRHKRDAALYYCYSSHIYSNRLWYLITVVYCITDWESWRTTGEDRRTAMTISQTMRVLHSSPKGKFHIEGVKIVMLQTYLKYKKA